jgi:hypothetical protein
MIPRSNDNEMLYVLFQECSHGTYPCEILNDELPSRGNVHSAIFVIVHGGDAGLERE